MKVNLKKEYKEFEDLFGSPPDIHQKAWDLIHDFYHIVLTYMKEKKISKADLARRLGKSRASISQMFNKTPNLSVKRMTEIADAIGIELKISTKDFQKRKKGKVVKETVYVYIPLTSKLNWQIMHASNKLSPPKTINFNADSSAVEYCCEDIMPS